jgi:hypothetical protein
MTTVAWDGKTLAADTLAIDSWGLKDRSDKIIRGNGWIAGGAGERHQILKWKRAAEDLTFHEVLALGVPDWHKDDNDPAILITDGDGSYRAMGGIFVRNTRPYYAIGSGRDFALAAMCCHVDAAGAVRVAMEFDNGTGGDIETATLTGSEVDRPS